MFREDFVWGVASSAYQIEGRDPADGCGRTIWEDFLANGGGKGGETAQVSADHMHRYEEDYALMERLGIRAYRFSINWCRILPEGTGRINEEGVAFYRDMMTAMRRHGITPYPTLYHWDLPQALQDRGGWQNPEIIRWFADYAAIAAERFSDLTDLFITVNEPECIVGLGYATGTHAPGYKLPPRETLAIAHNVLRAHGAAVRAIRAHAGKPVRVGYAPTCGVAIPATDSSADIEAARSVYFKVPEPKGNWPWTVSWFNDPVFLGHYPEDGKKQFGALLPEITPEDLALIAEPVDFMGQNIYNGYPIRAGADGKPEQLPLKRGIAKTSVGWPVTPECIYWGLKFLDERYHVPMYITENGMACHDVLSVDGRVHDPNRIHFVDAYLSNVQRAADEGADIRGYFLWTFLDNFEWEQGYGDRFGIVHVDFETLARTPKDSAYWYRQVMATNGRILSVNGTEAIREYYTPRADLYGEG